MSNVLKYSYFFLSLNIGIGLLLILFPDFQTMGATSNLGYDNTLLPGMTTNLNTTISPDSDLQDSGDQNTRLLDMLGLSYAYQFLKTIWAILFGMVTVIDTIFRPLLGDTLANFIKTAGYALTIFSYTMVLIRLLTGKDVIEGDS